MTTGGLIFLIIFFIVYKVLDAEQANKAKNYDYRKVSIGKLSKDAGKSKSYIYRKMINGEYDKDDKYVL